MRAVIECISKETGNTENTLKKDFDEYTAWLVRAGNRGYQMDKTNTNQYILTGGRGKNIFRVYLFD